MAALGRYIVMLGFAGARTALTLAKLHREEVQQRFPKHFLKQEDELRRVVNRLSELELQEEGSVPLQESEVFPALWKLAEDFDAGLDVELRKIPVLQFVIEVSELFDVNPYVNMTALENKECFRENVSEIQSENVTYSLLIVTDKPEEIIAFAEAIRLPSAIIGRLTDKNDRVVRNGEIIRYLTPEG